MELNPVQERRGSFNSKTGPQAKSTIREMKHPGYRTYQEGCRCAKCRALNAARMKAIRDKKKAAKV
jgi:hypothetical protein